MSSYDIGAAQTDENPLTNRSVELCLTNALSGIIFASVCMLTLLNNEFSFTVKLEYKQLDHYYFLIIIQSFGKCDFPLASPFLLILIIDSSASTV